MLPVGELHLGATATETAQGIGFGYLVGSATSASLCLPLRGPVPSVKFSAQVCVSWLILCLKNCQLLIMILKSGDRI